MSRKVSLYHEDERIMHAWMLLQKKIDTAFLNAGLGAVLYVDRYDGNDTSAERGSLVNTYATIQAALDAAQNGDLVLIGPGAYLEDVVIPATLDGITIQGSGRAATLILSANTGPTISYTAGATSTPLEFWIRDLSIIKLTANFDFAVDIDCSAIDSAFMEQGLFFENVRITRANSNNCLRITRANFVTIDDLYCGDPVLGAQDAVLQNVSRAFLTNVWAGTLIVDYDPAAPLPASGREVVAMTNSVLDTLSVLNCAAVFGGNDMQVTDLNQNTIDDGGPPILVGSVQYMGRVGTVFMEHSSTAASGAPADATISRFDKAFVSTAFTAQDAGASDQRWRVTANQAVFTYGTADSITVGDFCDLDLRGASYVNQEVLDVTGTGTIDRSTWVQLDASVAGGITFHNADPTAIPYPAGVTGAGSYHVSLEFDTIGDAPAAVSAKTDVGYTLGPTGVVGNVTTLVTRPYSD